MRLLILTQKVDKEDPILGFFHRWIEEFAKHAESVIVICLEEGRHELPQNVRVLSLGKERGVSKLGYVWNFYKFIWQERKNYDSVFVHMNQEYVILGGLFWKISGKKVMLWRNHAKGNIITSIAAVISDKVFCTSPHSYTAKFKKTRLMPVGVDTEFFKPDESVRRIPGSILFLGRISPVKNVLLYIKALEEIKNRGGEFTSTIAGPSLPRDKKYENLLRKEIARSDFNNDIKFTGPVTQEEALRLYREHEVYVNLTPVGSMDKTIFEAMACECVPVVANKDLNSTIPEALIVNKMDEVSVADSIRAALGKRVNLRSYVEMNHSLIKLISGIMELA